MSTAVRFLRLPQVCERRACSRASLYRAVAAGTFPPPIRRGRRTSVWVAGEVDAILAAEVAGAPDTELRALVARLVADRGGPGESSDIAPERRDNRGRFAGASSLPDAAR